MEFSVWKKRIRLFSVYRDNMNFIVLIVAMMRQNVDDFFRAARAQAGEDEYYAHG